MLSVNHLCRTTLDPVSEIEPPELPDTQVQVEVLLDQCYTLSQVLRSPKLQKILPQEFAFYSRLHLLQPAFPSLSTILEVFQPALLLLEGPEDRLHGLVTNIEQLGHGCRRLDLPSEICARLENKHHDRSPDLLWQLPPQALLTHDLSLLHLLRLQSWLRPKEIFHLSSRRR